MTNLTLILILTVLAAAAPVDGNNLPPVAVDDEVLVMGYTDYLEIPVFANDWDPDGDPLKVMAVLSVDRGKAVLHEGGAIGVSPDWSAVGPDDRAEPVLIAHGAYIVSDGLAESKAEWFVWH
jgi:hypothetical protein